MHFSIPDTQDLQDVNGYSYKAYNIHINGVLHCVVRYSQVYELNEQLKQQFGAQNIPNFPPKRFLQLKGVDLDERKLRLERYIQEISQNQTLASSEILATFLCKAQQETQHEESIPISFDIFLMNGHKVNIDISSTDKTNDVLENALATVGLKPELTYYFGLFLMRNDTSGVLIIRKLQEFECPYISLKRLEKRLLYKIVLRKTYWDQAFDDDVSADDIGFKLLKLQAESDVKNGWCECTSACKVHLDKLKSKGSKQEYFKMCQTLPKYGYLKFNPSISNFPKPFSMVGIAAGNYEIVLIFENKENAITEKVFHVKRMKCWKMSSHYDKSLNLNHSSDHPLLELSFEYLFEDGSLRWISIVSEQAIIMSMCIKSMVDELMRKRRGDRLKIPADRLASTSNSNISFKARDRSTEYLFNNPSEESADQVSAIQKAKESVKKLTEKLSMVSLLSKPADNLSATDSPSVTSNVLPPDIGKSTFEGIGDDDL